MGADRGLITTLIYGRRNSSERPTKWGHGVFSS
jgi:hypothetical protein